MYALHVKPLTLKKPGVCLWLSQLELAQKQTWDGDEKGYFYETRRSSLFEELLTSVKHPYRSTYAFSGSLKTCSVYNYSIRGDNVLFEEAHRKNISCQD